MNPFAANRPVWLRGYLQSHDFISDLGLCVLGLLLGIAALSVPLWWTVAALLGLGLMVIILTWPELLPLLYLVLTSTVISGFTQAPSFSIGLGTLYLTDVLLFLSFAYIIVRLVTTPQFTIVRTPIDLSLLIFWSASLVSTIIAISDSSLPWKQSLHEFRMVTSYLMFFVVTNLLRTKGQLIRLAKGLVLLATIVALVTIAEHYSGELRHMLAGRVETFDGVARIIPPGQSIIMVAFTAVFATLVLERATTLRFLQCGLLAVAIVVTFFRASWVVTGLSMLIIGVLAKGQETKRLVLCGLVATVMLTILVVVILEQPDSHEARLATAASARLESLFESRTFGSRHSSLRWRDFEYRFALPRILSHPFLGLGLGSRYRPLTSKDHEGFDGRSFIHNGHIYVLLKSGIVAYLGLLWFMLSVVMRGFRHWRRVPDPYMRGICLAFALTIMGVLIVSIVEPYIMQMPWTPLIGIIAGINETVFRQFSNQRSTAVAQIS
jgi:O-antigen ligase